MIRFFKIILSIIFVLSNFRPALAAGDVLSFLPVPGTRIDLSPMFEPALIKGLKVHPDNPFLFDFIVDSGNSSLDIQAPEFKAEGQKLIKYFLSALTVPEKDLWVNLSPYEKNRMIADNLGATQMGQDMLAQDYILKQITASLIYPEKGLGKEFWDKVYAQLGDAGKMVPLSMDAFNKVWIVADRADVYEGKDTAFVTSAHLKVLLETDYLALQKAQVSKSILRSPEQKYQDEAGLPQNNEVNDVMRQILLPVIEKEVNEGKNFAPLRQMYYSMILASWYKMRLQNALIAQVYGNQSKVGGSVTALNPKEKEAIFERYLKAYKKGVFNYIKEETIVNSIGLPEVQARKYFSGGFEMDTRKAIRTFGGDAPANLSSTGSFAMVTSPISIKSLSNKAMSTPFDQGQKKILVVIADPARRFAISLGLEAAGYQVEAVGSIETAREKVRAGGIDLIITGNREGTGVSFIQELNASTSTQSIPVMMSTTGEVPFIEAQRPKNFEGMLNNQNISGQVTEIFKRRAKTPDHAQSTVLIVDDSSTARYAFTRVLKEAGLEVEAVKSGEEALERLNKGGIGTVIADFQMKGMNGDELSNKIANAYPRTPVVLISESEEGEPMESILARGKFVRGFNKGKALEGERRDFVETLMSLTADTDLAQNVLVVEDDMVMAIQIEAALRTGGYVPTVVENIAQAKEALLTGKYGVLITDHNGIGDEKGTGLLKWAKAEPALQNVQLFWFANDPTAINDAKALLGEDRVISKTEADGVRQVSRMAVVEKIKAIAPPNPAQASASLQNRKVIVVSSDEDSRNEIKHLRGNNQELLIPNQNFHEAFDLKEAKAMLFKYPDEYKNALVVVLGKQSTQESFDKEGEEFKGHEVIWQTSPTFVYFWNPTEKTGRNIGVNEGENPVKHVLRTQFKDAASVATDQVGGIDFNNGTLNISKQGKGVAMKFDKDMINRIKQQGFEGLDFSIARIIPILNIQAVLGAN